MKLTNLVDSFPTSQSLAAQPRPYVNHSIELKRPTDARERAEIMERVGLNVFFFPAEYVSGCDLLSDSGTTTMTSEQWAALQTGDESYGSNRGYFLLLDAIRDTFGPEFASDPEQNQPNVFLFHQGRPAEGALFTFLGASGPGQVVPSNGHFDTTEANVEANSMQARNLFSPRLRSLDLDEHFKGDMDIEALENLLEKNPGKVPVIYLTITNNSGGGQPVSLQNIEQVHKIAHAHGIPLFFDAARFAENAWFIKHFEPGYESKSIPAIVRKMFSYVDGFTASFKKDGLTNMGGGLFFRSNGLFMEKYPDLADQLVDYQILKEGNPTYGGMSGRDIMTLATGLRTVVREEYLDYRVGQVRAFGEEMHELGLPVLMPIGGHAVYLDIDRFFEGTDMRPEDFGGIALTALLISLYGHRGCELGNFAFGHFDAAIGKEVPGEVNFVRFAVPRLRYEREDLSSVAQAVHALYQGRDQIPKVHVTYGRELTLRHFKARFSFV